MGSLRSLKFLKRTFELTFTATTQKANACSPWTACSVFNWKYLFWVNLFQNQNYQFKLKFGTKTNLNMQNSMVMLTFSVFDWKYLFG